MINEIYLLTHPYKAVLGSKIKKDEMLDYHHTWMNSMGEAVNNGAFSIVTFPEGPHKYKSLQKKFYNYIHLLVDEKDAKISSRTTERLNKDWFALKYLYENLLFNRDDVKVSARGVHTIDSVLDSCIYVSELFQIPKENVEIILSESIDQLTTDLNIESKHIPTYNSMKEQWGGKVDLDQLTNLIDVKFTDLGYTLDQRSFK